MKMLQRLIVKYFPCARDGRLTCADSNGLHTLELYHMYFVRLQERISDVDELGFS